MELAVPAPLRATARQAFISVLATQTDAIRELQSWRLPESELDSASERGLHKIGDHPFLGGYVGRVRAGCGSLFHFAGDERVQAASNWGRRWNLDVTWLHAWAVFALVAWDVVRRCTVPGCQYGCTAARADGRVSFELVLSQEAMLTFGEEPLFFSMLAAMEADKSAGNDSALSQSRLEGESEVSKLLPIHMKRVVAPLPGPHPLLETKDEFLGRAQRAWAEAVATLEGTGISLREPRKLGLHCVWLVRYHVRGETAAEIVKDLEDTDPSTVHKAVRATADLIGIPLRPSRGT